MDLGTRTTVHEHRLAFLLIRPGVLAVKAHERKGLLDRLDREGATVGADIPDRIAVQGEEIDLQQFVFEIKRRETIPLGERERVEQAKKNLRRERTQRRQRIESGEIEYTDGERLADSIVGIDRALNALENLGPTDLEAEAETTERADQKRWLSFLQKALGKNEDDKRRGRP